MKHIIFLPNAILQTKYFLNHILDIIYSYTEIFLLFSKQKTKYLTLKIVISKIDKYHNF